VKNGYDRLDARFVAFAKRAASVLCAEARSPRALGLTKRVTRSSGSWADAVPPVDSQGRLERRRRAPSGADQPCNCRPRSGVDRSCARGVRRLTGPIRIKVPSTLGFLRLNALVREFAELHPDVDVEVLLLDGPMNPAVEGIDIAVTGVFRRVLTMVADEFLWPLRRSLFASRQYLSAYPRLDHPRQLEEHRCLVYQTHWPELAIPEPQRAR